MSGFWIAIDRFKGVLVLAGLVAPLLGSAIGAILGSRRRPGSGESRTGVWAGRGLVLGALSIIPLIYLGMCATPPGRGALAADGYRRAEVVLSALETYRTQVGSYPDSLRQLAPAFLPESALVGPQHQAFAIHRESNGFVLSFTYAGPGRNECRYPSSTRVWNCAGYY
jgi:hypothetical protein